MDENKVIEAMKELLKQKNSKNFTQSVDLIVNLKEIDLKKNDQQVDFFHNLPNSKGKENKVCALVGPELVEQANEYCDKVIEAHDFDEIGKDKKKVKKLAEEYDLFIAQANVMPQIAKAFGKILGSRGKMPNPKSGGILAPKANIEPVIERLRRTIRITAKSSLSVKASVGNEKMSEDELKENILSLYNALVSHTPQGKENIKNMFVKLTMSKPIKID
ncbi:MAG: 50S ribosomal protein L1 [Nanobdellota archaeon]